VQLYEFLNMPPMPPRPQDVDARARSVRAVLSYVEQTENPVLCLAPEGADVPGGKISMPPAGAGRFMLLLSRAGLPITPAGGWQDEDGALCIHFGPPFHLSAPPGLQADEKDCYAAREVMTRLALLLPPQLRGDFS
ncbi:MAG: hypothetical protein AB1649_09950, partial [Chloroflexota bacterium]